MGDSFKKHDDLQEQIERELEFKNEDNPASLQQDITRLQGQISRLYTEELFRARIRITELELRIKELEKENNSLLDKVAVLSGEQLSYTRTTNANESEDKDDWYTSHGQGD